MRCLYGNSEEIEDKNDITEFSFSKKKIYAMSRNFISMAQQTVRYRLEMKWICLLILTVFRRINGKCIRK